MVEARMPLRGEQSHVDGERPQKRLQQRTLVPQSCNNVCQTSTSSPIDEEPSDWKGKAFLVLILALYYE
jgi:hypothetical protein